MKTLSSFIAFTALCAAIFLGITSVAHAAATSSCYVDPVTVVDWTAVLTAPTVGRDQACSLNSDATNSFNLQTGTVVHVIATTNGWYRIEINQKRTWIASDLLNVTDKRFGGTIFASYNLYMSKYAIDVNGAPSSATPVDPNNTVTANSSQPASASNTPTYYDPALLGRMSGYILLQVQSHGEAWYVDPVSAKRYYMPDGGTAYQMMRSFGLGTTEADYKKIAAGNYALKKQLSGRIVLRVQAHGEAYYIHPGDLKVYYLQNGDAAYQVMRLHSLGITNADLAKLQTGEIQIK